MSRHLVFRALNVCLLSLYALFCLALVAPAPALAQHGAGGKKSIAVGTVEGPQGEATRRRVLQTLKKSGQYEITDAEDLRPGSDKGAYAAMAQALQVDAIVVGRVSRSRDLTLSVIGPDGNLIEDVKLKGGNQGDLDEAIDNELETAIAGPLGGKKAKPAAKKVEEEPPPEDEEEALPGEEKSEDEEEDKGDEAKAEEEQPAAEPSKAGLRPLELLLGFRLYNRSFAYNGVPAPMEGRFLAYKLGIAPAIATAARIYPFAFFRDDALANLGLMAKVEFGIATSTNYEQPQPAGAPPIVYKLNNGTSEWQLGLRGRLPMGASELGIFGLYGSHSFVIVGDEGTTGTPNPLVPDVNYNFLRFGFDARLRVSKFTVGSHFGARFLTSMKNIDQDYWWFPGATGSGIDFGAMLAYELLSFMDVAVGADFIRYGFDFNGIPDDAGLPGSKAQKIAGGATDTFLSGWLGVIFHFGGTASAGGGEVSVEAAPSEESKPSTPTEEEEPEIE